MSGLGVVRVAEQAGEEAGEEAINGWRPIPSADLEYNSMSFMSFMSSCKPRSCEVRDARVSKVVAEIFFFGFRSQLKFN